MPPRPFGPPRPIERRKFLTGALRVAAAGVLLPGLPRLTGCAPEKKSGGTVTVDVSGLAPGERLVVETAEIPLELIRTPEGVLARSLLCTHQGCLVHWVESDGEYVCPCHDARFDEDGVPFAGPARRPLRLLPLELRGDEAHVQLWEAEA